MTAPLISVIVPVYKAEAFLEQCAASVLGQDHRELELLLVDDGSPDNSGKMCDALAARDPRVRVFHKPNGGPSSARNLALESAKGDYVFFLDADDLVPPGAFPALLQNCRASGADMAVGAFERFSGELRQPQPGPVFSSAVVLGRKELTEYAFSYLRAPNRNILFAYSWGRLFRAAIIRERGLRFDPALHTFEDVAFNFEFLRSAASVSYLPEPVYHHRIYDTFSSATMNIGGGLKKMFGYRTALRAIASFLDEAAPGPAVAAAAGHANVSLTIIQLVRVCGQLNDANRRQIADLVAEVVGDAAFQSDLGHYSPSGRDSRLLPLLMRFKLVSLIMLVCRYKARKRYGKGAR